MAALKGPPFLVENAIRHGIARRSDAGRVRVVARRDGDMLELSVSDDGPGFDEAAPIPKGHGIDNTRESRTRRDPKHAPGPKRKRRRGDREENEERVPGDVRPFREHAQNVRQRDQAKDHAGGCNICLHRCSLRADLLITLRCIPGGEQTCGFLDVDRLHQNTFLPIR